MAVLKRGWGKQDPVRGRGVAGFTTTDLRECKYQQESQHRCVFPTSSAAVRAAAAPVQLLPLRPLKGELQQIHCFIPPPLQRELAEPTLDFCCEIWRKECEILH